MNKTKLFLTSSMLCSLLCLGNADAKSVYVNNAGAININMLTVQMMDFAHNGESMSDIILDASKLYGTMTRLDEYGDDGIRPVKGLLESAEPLGKLFWLDARHVNTDVDYNDAVSGRERLYMATVGFNTKSIDLPYGTLSFGAFLGNITQHLFSVSQNGFTFGVVSRYKYKNFDLNGMVNNGSINKTKDYSLFNQSWLNAALDTSVNIPVSDVFFIKPGVYFGYTKVFADELRFDGNVIPDKDFEFMNLAPSAKIYTRLTRNLYASLSAKYVALYGDIEKNVYVNGALVDETKAKNYSEFGLGLEYDYNDFIFTGGLRKQNGGFNGWECDVNVKYLF